MSVHEFYRLKELITLEEVNTIEWSKKKRIFFIKTAMVGYCKLSLNANVSCDEHLVEIYLHSHLVSLVFFKFKFHLIFILIIFLYFSIYVYLFIYFDLFLNMFSIFLNKTGISS